MLVQIHDSFWVNPEMVVKMFIEDRPEKTAVPRLYIHYKTGEQTSLEIDEEWHKRWRPQLDWRLSGQKMVYYVCQRCAHQAEPGEVVPTNGP